MKTKAGLLILAFAFCLTVSLVKAEATFGAWLPEDLLFSTTNASGNPAIVAFNSPYYLVVGQDNQGSHPTFIQYAQAVGYSQSGNILTVNSTADPGDGVCTPTDCTLREAIIAANNMFGPVTIYLPAGTITLAVPGRGEDGALWGDLDITNELIIIGKGQMATIIDGGQLDRIIHLLPGTNVVLAQMTIRNGLAGDGGGILNEGTLTLKQCTVSGNQVSYNLPEGSGNNSGGGILNLGTLQIVNSTITNNSTDRLMGDGPGGGIQNKGTLIINKTIFTHNWAAGGAGIYNDGGMVSVKSGTFNNNGVRFFGGALLNRSPGTFTVDRSIIQNNIESVYNAGTLNITNSTIRDNQGYRVVGGIFNDNGTLHISGSTLAYNTGPSGGLATSGTATLVNSTISHNTALYQDMASGIRARGGTLSLLNCTLASNSGGVAGLYNDSSGSTNVRNSIIAENTPANCTGSFVSGGYNLDSDGSCGFNSKGDLVAAPLLGPLQNNGGQTETHALLTGSPAIDHIPIKACGVRTDQRGVARPIDGNEDGLLACDVGAYELNP